MANRHLFALACATSVKDCRDFIASKRTVENFNLIDEAVKSEWSRSVRLGSNCQT